MRNEPLVFLDQSDEPSGCVKLSECVKMTQLVEGKPGSFLASQAWAALSPGIANK